MPLTRCHAPLHRLFPLWLLIAGCGGGDPQRSEEPLTPAEGPAETMQLTSTTFEDGAQLDARFTVEGEDVSPPLAWSDVPEGTRSLALICEDPDAPSPRNPAPEPWVHWVLYNIPPDVTQLPAEVSREPQPGQVPGALQGTNSWSSDNLGYRGPAPPPGSGAHRYFFRLYAVDKKLDLEPGATRQQVKEAMAGHVLAEAQLHGTYER